MNVERARRLILIEYVDVISRLSLLAMNELDRILLDFVEGRLSASAFEQLLYTDSNLESRLRDEARLPAGYYVKDDVYTFLIQLDYQNLDDVLNAVGAVGDFLKRKRIAFKPTADYEELSALILAAQPAWLNVETSYVSQTLLPLADRRSGKELQKWLKKQFAEKFKYVSKPPLWLQNPDWLFAQGEPLIFLGQLSVERFFHDQAAVYVFYNPKTNACHTIVQMS